MAKITVRSFSDSQKLSLFAAKLFEQTVLQALASRGRCLVLLSGGGTPETLYRLLARPPYRAGLPWSKILFFWGDERCVPPDDPGSNYHQAWQAFLGQLPVQPGNIYRVLGERTPPEAAVDYARQLKSQASHGLDWPRFDLALMGLGADGHTASLFPGSPDAPGLAVVPVVAQYQDRPANRVSLTPPVFNAARRVIFLVTGAEKAGALLATLVGPPDTLKYPAQRIRPLDGELWFLADEAAASQLPTRIKGLNIRH
ncbi:MAG TPA: 6-phosphogluconolactonase [Anaerolineales bacterium]|jgi:6-phosphogluconolactonase